jgi:hypothetical protein
MRITLLILFVFCACAGFSQEPLNKLSVSPIQLFGYNRLNLEYERGFKEGKYGISFYLGRTGLATRKIHGQYSYLSEQSGSLKFYTNNFCSSSFWYGGTVSVASGNSISENKQDSAINISAIGLLAGGGYQLIIKSFYLNTYLNVGYALTNDLFGTATYTGNMSKPTDFLLTYGFNIGICF